MADVTIAEEPVTIPENHVAIAEPHSGHTMAEQTEGETTVVEDAALRPLRGPIIAEHIEDAPAPKRKPGRPLGSKSAVPGKPRAPRAKKVVVVDEEPVVCEAVAERHSPEPKALPRMTPGAMPIPEEAYDLRTAKMLRLLQLQSDTRKDQKRRTYSSWFR